MTAVAPAREPFDPLDTSFDPAKHSVRDDIDTVESPSLSSSNALARFEFEFGRSKDGTKVLMVEWEEDETSKNIRGDWEISWEGKRTVLPARDQAQHGGAGGGGDEAALNRLYFLLGAGVAIPTQVVLTKSSLVWKTNPLPAIFSPELGATATASGKKGVLHTIWAKKRLQVLQGEIKREEETNAEGIGLEMAQAEKEWIEQNFGVVARPLGLNIPTSPSGAGPTSPSSPRSPGGGRLMDKLRGLRIDTQEAPPQSPRFSGQLQSTTTYPAHNPLSPESSDVALGSYGSFAALKGQHPSNTTTARTSTQVRQSNSVSPQPRMAAVRPPESFAAQQRQSPGMGSLNAFASSGGFPQAVAGASSSLTTGPAAADDDREDDLFALPISPRSPEMAKSPFSLLKG